MTQTPTQATIPIQSHSERPTPTVVPAPPYDPALPPAIIVDIDGTVAINDGHRGHFDWAKVGQDKPNPWVVTLVRQLSRAGYWVLFTTGRMKECEFETRQWIDGEIAISRWQLFMRDTGDYRPDFEVKLELYNKHIRGQFNVLFALDDRNQVVDLWRNHLKIPVAQVADGDF